MKNMIGLFRSSLLKLTLGFGGPRADHVDCAII